MYREPISRDYDRKLFHQKSIHFTTVRSPVSRYRLATVARFVLLSFCKVTHGRETKQMNQKRKPEAAGGHPTPGTGRRASVVTCFPTKFERRTGNKWKTDVRRTPRFSSNSTRTCLPRSDTGIRDFVNAIRIIVVPTPIVRESRRSSPRRSFGLVTARK